MASSNLRRAEGEYALVQERDERRPDMKSIGDAKGMAARRYGPERRSCFECGLAVFFLCGLLSSCPAGRAVAAPPPDGWSITVTASRPGARDEGRMTIGATTAARDGYDAFDRAHPPVFPRGFIDICTRHLQSEEGWESQSLPAVRYLAEYGPQLMGMNREIAFSLQTDEADMASLSWKKVTNPLLQDYNVQIRDVSADMTIDMKRQTFYDLDMEAGVRPFQMLLTVRDLPTPTGTVPPTHTWIPTHTTTPTPEPSITPTLTPTFTPTLEPTFTPTSTPPPMEGWWELFEMANVWEEADYEGPCDRNQDGIVDAMDLLDLCHCWHEAGAGSKGE